MFNSLTRLLENGMIASRHADNVLGSSLGFGNNRLGEGSDAGEYLTCAEAALSRQTHPMPAL